MDGQRWVVVFQSFPGIIAFTIAALIFWLALGAS